MLNHGGWFERKNNYREIRKIRRMGEKERKEEFCREEGDKNRRRREKEREEIRK